jgi:hypothetical protein
MFALQAQVIFVEPIDKRFRSITDAIFQGRLVYHNSKASRQIPSGPIEEDWRHGGRVPGKDGRSGEGVLGDERQDSHSASLEGQRIRRIRRIPSL